MSDTVSFGSCGSCGTCGSCDCDCFGNVGGGDSGTYEVTSNGEVIADVIETALDIGLNAYEPVPTNTARKKPQDADADADTDTCQNTICVTIFFLVVSVIGK